VGDGLATSVNRLRLPDADGVVVLLTDGESNRGTVDARNAADAAATLGVRVYTVGVGSDGIAPVPVDALPAGFRYAELPVGLDEELLQEIAERTGGQYFRATDPEALGRIYAEIDRLVPSVVETTRYQEPTNWSALFLVIAAAALAGEWLARGSRWGPLP
jgi:Ca-activated chloride channel family protein